MTLRRIARTFFTGLAVVLPLAVTVAVLAWLVAFTERIVGGFVGLLVAVVVVFGIGLLMEAFYFRQLMAWFEGLLERIPLVKTVYSAVRDLMSLFSQAGSKKFSKVVMVKFPGTEAGAIGFVTIEDFTGLPVAPGAGTVAVYLPMSYTIGGYTLFLPREWLTPVDMSLEEAMRFVVTAGMSRSS